jgi:predicted nucleic acid-binding protein
MERLFVDSNVWVYLFTAEDIVKCKIAEDFIRQNANENVLVISFQVVNEVANTLKRRSFTESQIRYVIENMFNLCLVQDNSRDIVFLASELREKHTFSFWDSLIIAVASISQCNRLISEDMQHGRIINGVAVTNIFME